MPYLLISGHPGTNELLLDAREGGNSFEILAKPLHPSFILDTVSGLLPQDRDGNLNSAEAN